MNELQWIIDQCKGPVYLDMNQHRSDYATVADWFSRLLLYGTPHGVAGDVMAEMVSRDTIVHLQFYPDSPVSFYSVYHYDVASAISEAAKILRADRA